jgi:hypothetical protein
MPDPSPKPNQTRASKEEMEGGFEPDDAIDRTGRTAAERAAEPMIDGPEAADPLDLTARWAYRTRGRGRAGDLITAAPQAAMDRRRFRCLAGPDCAGTRPPGTGRRDRPPRAR